MGIKIIILLLVLSILGLPLVLACPPSTICTPSSGYNYCYQSYCDTGQMGNNVVINFNYPEYQRELYKDNVFYWIKPYMDFKCYGWYGGYPQSDGTAYVKYNLPNNGQWGNDFGCSKEGCQGPSGVGSGSIKFGNVGDVLNKGTVIGILCHNLQTASDGSLGWLTSGGGFILNNDIRIIQCAADSDCSGYCDTSGDWTTWQCRDKECDNGQEGCDGQNSWICENYKKVNKGIINGKCGIECLIDGQESCSGKDSMICSNYKLTNNGRILGKCGVECLTDNECLNKPKPIISITNPSNNYYKCSDSTCIPVDKIKVYRNTQNCSELLIYPPDAISNDYDTLKLCQDSLSKPNYLIWIVGFIMVLGLTYFIWRNYYG